LSRGGSRSGTMATAECGGGGSSVRAYKDGIDQHNSDGGPDTIRSDVREYQLLWMPDGLEEEQEGTWAMLVAVNAKGDCGGPTIPPE
jgi:hypothetical protein